MAAFFAEDGEIVINRGNPRSDRDRVRDMAAGFYADALDLTLTCDDIRLAGTHAVYAWTFTAHDASTGNPLSIRDWEEREPGVGLKVKATRGWFDADDDARLAKGR